MSDVWVFIITILGIINFFSMFTVVCPFTNDSLLSSSLYYKIWHIKNSNIAGKILLTIVISPFIIVGQLMLLLLCMLYITAFYIVFGICWLFAIDRNDTISAWLGNKYIGKKHKLLMYVKDIII